MRLWTSVAIRITYLRGLSASCPTAKMWLSTQQKYIFSSNIDNVKIFDLSVESVAVQVTSTFPKWQISSVATISKFVRQVSQDNTNAADAVFSGWSWIDEPVGISSNSAFTKLGLQEQINTTADKSDYLWYSLRYLSFTLTITNLFWFSFGILISCDCFSVEIKGDEPFLINGSQTKLHVDSLGHGLYAFVNGQLAGNGKNMLLTYPYRILYIFVYHKIMNYE